MTMRIRPHQSVWRFIWPAMVVCGIATAHAQGVSEGERKHGICVSCHGIGGRSFKVHYPILAGQRASYIVRQLNDFKEGRRSDPIMDGIAAQLTEQDMRDLADFFASRGPYSGRFKPDSAKAARGRRMARSAHCADCHPAHADSGIGASPRIQGQHYDYLVKQLREFRDGLRTNDGGVMQGIAQSMSDADIDDLANFFARSR